MRELNTLFILIIFFGLTSKGQNCDTNKTLLTVSEQLKTSQPFYYDSTKVRGYNEELTIIKTPTLNIVLPDYCFYSGTFRGTSYHYLSVKTAFAFTNSPNYKSAILHSPTYISESKDFINIFYGIKSSDTLQSIKVASEIMDIFSKITYEGRFARLINLKEKNVISFELWHDNLSWRIYDFYFNESNVLTAIKIQGGVKQNEIREGYKRN